MERYRFTDQVQNAYEELKQPLAIYQFVNKRVVTLVLSDGFCELFGYKERSQAYYDMDSNMYKDTHPDDVSRIADAAYRFAIGKGDYEVIYRTRINKGNEYKVIHAVGRHIYTEEGIRLAHVWYTDEGTYTEDPSADVSELNRALNQLLHEQSLMKVTSYDHLTGLPSMTYFFELAEEGKETLINEGEEPALLYFDMSGMKFYNKKYGFAEGDNLIKEFSKLLISTFSNENCSHFGGDHFAVYTQQKGLEDTLNKLFDKWSEMHDSNELPIRVGIYLNSMEDVNASTACDRAKLACDSLRNSYASGFSYYSKDLGDDLAKRQYIVSNIDRAIKEKHIQVYYQPIVRAVNGRVSDEEALARWIDPEKGFMSPADFIPYLEDAGKIYKLDLYVLDRVLEKIHIMKEKGLHTVPQSINLSRSDFDSCDIVEEIRKRVDKAGVSHNLITIEITESIIGADFEFLKTQIERFQKLGFSVWMDDFGSGYSSLDVLQSINFDLIKFDMIFMKRLDEGNAGKIILTDLMRMATSLGVDTVCEGVETIEQIHFLQAIGCSKLQGYYYLKPISLEHILERYEKGTCIGLENPKESVYYDSMGRINLYDLSFLANKDENALRNTFNTLPMGVLEVSYDLKNMQIVRSNDSFRDFLKRSFGFDIDDPNVEYSIISHGTGSVFVRKLKQTRHDGDRVFIEERLTNGNIVHTFARRIGVNPVTNKIAFAVAVLSVTEPNDGTTYASIARALAADYYNIYYVDLANGDYIEYTSTVGGDELVVERHGKDFFNSAKVDTMTRIYDKDREMFLSRFTKENIIRELDEQGVFMITYRLIDTGEPVYARMKITRMELDAHHIIIGISIIDSQMKQKETADKLRREREALGRIAALSGKYIVLYTVDPVTDHYVQYNPSKEIESFGLAKQGENFFEQVKIDAPKAIYSEDIEEHLKVLTKENMMSEIRKKGYFVHHYRMIINGEPKPCNLKAALIEEEDGEKIILGVRMS